MSPAVEMWDPELAEILSFVNEVFSTEDESEVARDMARPATVPLPGITSDDYIRTFNSVSSPDRMPWPSLITVMFRLTDGNLEERR